MARQKGSYSLAGTMEVLADAPADARLQVKTVADLTASGSFPYKYVGMIVSVESTQEAYMLVGSDPTVASNWEKQGSGSEGVELTQTQYDALSQAEKMNGTTYYITDSQGSGGVSVCVSDLTDVELDSLSDGQVLQYDGTNDEWVNADVPKGGAYPLVTTLPEPTNEWYHKKVQYVGETSQDRMYVNGTVYYCREAPDSGLGWYAASQDFLDGYLRFASPFSYDTIVDANNAAQKSELRLTMDSTPTSDSQLPIKSGGVYTALANKRDKVSYSTSEKALGITWTNGSALYQRTYTGTINSYGNNVQVAAFSYYMNVIDFEGSLYKSGDSTCVPANFYLPANGNYAIPYAAAGYIQFACNSGMVGYSYRLTVTYYK